MNKIVHLNFELHSGSQFSRDNDKKLDFEVTKRLFHKLKFIKNEFFVFIEIKMIISMDGLSTISRRTLPNGNIYVLDFLINSIHFDNLLKVNIH